MLPTATTLATTTSRPPNIIWDENRVRKLVTWIVDRPADRHILYNDRNQSGSAPPLSNEHSSGKQKKDIHAAIAKHIFEGEDPEYSNNPSCYAKSVSNRLIAYVHTHTTLAYPDFLIESGLKTDYWKSLGKFKQTGAGVDPNGPAKNLHCTSCCFYSLLVLRTPNRGVENYSVVTILVD